MGLFDRIFGEKAIIQVPQPDGSMRAVKVSVRWLEEMERQGKISTVMSPSIRVHILDPQAGLAQELAHQYSMPPEILQELGMSRAVEKYRVEEWKVGEEISAAEYFRSRDRNTGELYVFLEYQAGESVVRVMPRESWVQARHSMGV